MSIFDFRFSIALRSFVRSWIARPELRLVPLRRSELSYEGFGGGGVAYAIEWTWPNGTCDIDTVGYAEAGDIIPMPFSFRKPLLAWAGESDEVITTGAVLR